VKRNTGNYFEMDPSFMYGPTLSLDISNKWKISTTALFGNFEYETGYTFVTSGRKRVLKGEEFKWDADITLQYLFNRYLFLFGGIKYQGYNSETDITILNSSGVVLNEFSSETRYYQYGPGLGIGCALPLWDSTILSCNINFIGEYATDNDSEDKTADYWVYGINTTLGVAYYSKMLRTSFFLGAKFQMFHYVGQDGTDAEKSDGKNDLFYGIIFSAVYRL